MTDLELYPPPDLRPKSFLDGGGAASRLILERDWSVHPLGPPEAWPDALKVALGIVLNSPESMILAWGPDLHFFFNETYFPLLGPRLPWAMGARFKDVWADAWEQAQPIIAEAFAGRSTRYVDLPWKLGTDRGDRDTWWTFSYSRVLDRDGAVAGLFIVTNETTRLVLSRAAENRNRQILDSITDSAVIATDLDGRITRWNEGAHHALGWAEAEMLGRTTACLFTPEDQAGGRAEQEMRHAKEAGRMNDELWHCRKGGERFWAAVEMTPLRDEAGAYIGFVKVLRDRTEHRVAEESLRSAEAQLRRAQEAGGIGVFSIDNDGMLHASPAFCRLYGVPERDHIPVKTFEALVVPDDSGLVSTAEGRATGRVPVDIEYRIRRADTGALRWIARKGEIERDEDGRPVRFVGVARDITEQFATRLALATEREQLAQMFEQAPTFMAMLRGPEHRIERVNPGYVRLIGGRDVVGKLLREALPDAVEQGFLGILDRVYRTGEPFMDSGSRYAVQAAPDEPVNERFVDFVFQPIRDATGQVTGIFVQGADVTERTLAEAAHRASEAQFRVFAQTLPNQIWAARPDGYLDWFNQQVYAYTGAAPGTLDGAETWVSVVHPEDLPAAGAAWGHSLAAGEVYETEFRIRRADGAYRWFLVRAEPVRTPKGQLTRWVGTNTDIEDNRRQAVQLAELNARLEVQVRERTRELDRIWRSTNDLMATVGVDGLLKSVNPAWTRMLGWDEGQLLAQRFLSVVADNDHAAIGDLGRRITTGGTVGNTVSDMLCKDGRRRTVQWDAVPDGDFVHMIGRDITEQRQAEEQLRQSQKMEAVGQLTGGIAHDFNNLLTGITGSLELLSSRIAQGRLNDVERYTTAAQGAARRAAALTHRLLAFSRRQTLDPKPTDLNRLVLGLEELVRRTVGPSIKIEIVAAGGLWPTLVDQGQLENAILNLCINARDALPDGGRITIESANRWMDRRTAAAQNVPPGQYISMSVSDNGTGMTPDVVARAFDPFFTTKPIGQGTGLGLSMIYGFARQSGGQVRIYSEVGQGTNVCLYLPRHLGELDPVDPPPGPSEVPRAGAGETVLVVDDEPSVRMLVTETLEDLGYAAIEAADGPAGLRVLQSDARIDLLVTDVGLPGGMNGRQMVDAARLKRPGLKVLFITGYAENAVVGNGQLEAGMHVMTKPFAMDTLATRIKDLIGGS